MPEWLTYAQVAERFGLTRDAARMRARRLHWRIQPGNDGRTLVLVPDDTDLLPRPRLPGRPDERSPEHAAEIDRLTTLLSAADERTAWAEHRAEQAEQRADEAMKRADAANSDRRAAMALADQTVAMLTDAQVRADRAEAALGAERGTADALRERIKETERAKMVMVDEFERDLAKARSRATEAEQAADRARAATQETMETTKEARKARGRLRRILVVGRVMASPAGAATVGAAIGAAVGVVIELKQDWAVLNSLVLEDFWLHLLGGAIGVGAIGAVAGFIVGWLRQGQDRSQ